jgi:hypothetical protein
METDPERKAKVEKCHQCGQPDSQNHRMLGCKKDKDLDFIRQAARMKQDAIA